MGQIHSKGLVKTCINILRDTVLANPVMAGTPHWKDLILAAAAKNCGMPWWPITTKQQSVAGQSRQHNLSLSTVSIGRIVHPWNHTPLSIASVDPVGGQAGENLLSDTFTCTRIHCFVGRDPTLMHRSKLPAFLLHKLQTLPITVWQRN